jgi:hypothetical protein
MQARNGSCSIEAPTPPAEAGVQLVQEPAEIGRMLRELAEPSAEVQAYLNGGLAAGPACLLDVDIGQARLRIDCSGVMPAMHAQTYNGVLCIAQYHDDQLQFTLDGVVPLTDGRPGRFSAALPGELRRSQRRAFPRLGVPLGRPFQAEFTVYGETYCANVYDLSLGGVGLRAAPRDVPELYAGKRLPKVSLELGHGTLLTVDLEVRMWRPFRSRLLGEQVHIGCRFVDLAPVAQAKLARVVGALESRSG